ncbi:MAG TPA: TonB-dependent receptor [Blastocatellia bacterium]|nr:TonB-dependent receptor [Blastocatellia bacterium]
MSGFVIDPNGGLTPSSLKQRRKAGHWSVHVRLWPLLVIILSVGSSFGQETRATLGGKVVDVQGRVLPDATVTVTAEETGVKQTTRANGEGNWRVQFLLPGPYHFDVEAPGFKKVVQSIKLQVADQKFIDVTLEVGLASETVTVNAAPTLIDTTAAVSGTVITTDLLEELPTQTNSPIDFVRLTPGAKSGLSLGRLWSNISLSNNSVNGAGSGVRSINYQIDGADNTNGAGQMAFAPPVDAVAEVRVATNAYDAAVGRQTGATINLSTKSGTRDFHGTLYWYNQNDFLNANRFENNATGISVPVVRVNEYGASIGGPVLLPRILDGRKKQTFFFFSFDGLRSGTPAATGFMSLPTMLERQGDFSQSYVTQTVNGVRTRFPLLIYNPYQVDAAGNRAQFPNNVIPQVSPIAKAIFALMPAPDNAGDGSCSWCNNYLKRTVQDVKFRSFSPRIDQAWNNNHHSYLSMRYNNFDELAFDPFGKDNLLQGLTQNRINRGLTADHTWVISPRFVLDLRFNLTSWDGSSSNSGAGVDPTQYGFPASLAALQQVPSIPLLTGLESGAETGGLGTNQAQDYTYDKKYTFGGFMTQTSGNHTFRYGVEHIIQLQGRGNLGQSGGRFDFRNNWTTLNPTVTPGVGVGSNVASFVLGLPTGGTIPTNATADWKQHNTGLYLQDDWRTTSKLTLNLGLRWDFQLPATEREARFYSRFNPDLSIVPVTNFAQPNYRALVASASTSPGIRLLQQFRPDDSNFVARGGILYAGRDGTSRYVENPQYKYFQPRLGIAYRFRDRLVVRSGFGRFVEANFNLGNQGGFSQGTPFIATTDNFRTPLNTLANPYPDGKVSPIGNSLGVLTNIGSVGGYTDPDIGRVYVDQVSLHVQYQWRDLLFEVGGIYNRTAGLGVGYFTNLPNVEVWRAAFGPAFDASGRPLDPRPGDTLVTNPFRNAPYLTPGSSLATSQNIGAYNLLRPNPVLGDLTETRAAGTSSYKALQMKVERRLKDGFSLLGTFSWSRKMTKNGFLTPQIVSQELANQIDGNDRPIVAALTSTYTLPFGRGKFFGRSLSKRWDRLIGGWEITGIYTYATGTPVALPTNGSFFKGGDPGRNFKRTDSQWFDTSLFAPFPSRNTTVEQLRAYPSWTGVQDLPGYNWAPTSATDPRNGVYQDFATRVTSNPRLFTSVRNPADSDLGIGLRKNIPLTEKMRVQLRMDAFNALNRPQFGNVNTDPNSPFFGVLGGSTIPTQVNSPRTIQLGIKLYF